MKKAELTKLRAKGEEELEKIVADKRLEAIKTRADIKANREKNPKKVKNIRQDIAQILTLIREKEIVRDEKSQAPSTKSQTNSNDQNTKPKTEV